VPVRGNDIKDPNSPPLHEAASGAQATWAREYARRHHRRRRLTWVIAVCMAGFIGVGIPPLIGGPSWEAIVLAVFFTAGPLGCIGVAAQDAVKADPAGSYWRIAWAMMLLTSAEFIWHYHDSGHLAYGIVQALCAVSVPLSLFCALRIPLDPSVDWDAVYDDFLANVRTGDDRKAYPCRIRDDKQAEEVCAGWLKRFGYADARVSGKTKSGHDDGIDVYAAGAVAQVKYWLNDRVRIKDVQRLVGSAAPGQAKFFFAASGYTRNAAKWAAHPDRRIALFRLLPDGHLVALNYHAKKRLWFQPFRLMVRGGSPRSVRLAVVTAIFLGLGTIFYVATLAYILAASGATMEGITVMVLLAALFLVAFLLTSAGLARRLIRGVVDYLRRRQWAGWRDILVGPERPAPVSLLPPDSFVSYEGMGWLRMITMTFDLVSTARICRNLVWARARSIVRTR
jgi:Restriction endonuclease